MAANEETVQSKNIDHLGLVAGLCEELNIAGRVNELLGPADAQRVVSAGTCVVAMLLNGLGFSNRRLYLSPQFFENKPVQKLLNDSIQASDLNDHALGRTLDEIADYGSTRLFADIAFTIADEKQLLSPLAHLDTTSFKVHGNYEADDSVQSIQITHGFSKDHRPDLKQVVLSMVTSGAADIPIWMEPLDGNSADKTSLPDTIERVRAFRSQIDADENFKWVADSALYSKDRLLQSDCLWLTRVPQSINEAKCLVELNEEEISWQEVGDGYWIHSVKCHYGDKAQRWLLVYSEQAFERERKTFEKRLDKEKAAFEKKFWHLTNEQFQCKEDALSALEKFREHRIHFDVVAQIVPVAKHKKSGRPRKNQEPDVIGYAITGSVIEDEEIISSSLNKKGRFILATNDLNADDYPDEQMLWDYKSQQGVERGFRFMKDPWFMADKLYLKSAKRIEALMMIMCLSLFIYNYGQYKIREVLKETEETLPNQKNREIQNPTLRWLFQVMEGVALVSINQAEHQMEVITNLSPVRKKIIHLLGPQVCRQYGIIVENPI